MANKVVATEAAVFAAADGLKARGVKEPTYEDIVDALGGGSNSTIKPHLINWKQMTAVPSRPVPESVDARAKVFAEATWAIAFKEAQAVFDRAKQLTEGEVDRSKQALTSSIAINEQLESQCNALELRLKSVESDLLEARVNLRQVDELKVELAETRECVEKHRQDCESLNQVVATLRGENSVLRDQGQQLLARVTLAKPRSRAAAGRANKSTS